MEKSDNSIYRWLSRVTAGGQAPGASGARVSSGAPYTCPSLTEFADYLDDDGRAYPLKSFSESMDLTPQFRWPHFKKRTRDTPTREEPPRDEPSVAKWINKYERKPRHKTRKDRYKYKTTGTPRRDPSEVPEPKAKRQHRSRKQSMNDGFHASNVARNRLTLTNTANLGIFSRGRASSPVKLRDLPNLAFSETDFLSWKTLDNGRVSMSAVNEPKGQKQPSHVYDVFNLQSRDASEKLGVYLTNTFPQRPAECVGRFERIDATRPRRNLSPSKTTGLADLTKTTHVPPDTKDVDSQVLEDPYKIRPATPYTWSESGGATASLGAIVEDHLLNILHVGLFPEPQIGSEVEVGSKYYYSLQDLKMLLEARKESWQSNESGEEATFQPASPFASPQQPGSQIPDIEGEEEEEEEEAKASISELEVALAERNIYPEISKTCEGDLLWGSQSQVDSNGNAFSNLSSLRSPKVGKPHMADADSFFRALDAKFCSIMGPSNNYLEPARQSLKTQPTLEVDQHADISLRRQTKSTVNSLSSLRLDRSGTAHPAPHTIPSQDNRRMLPVPPMSNGCIKKTSSDAPESSARHPFSVLTNASAFKHATLPSGFWRQNKLY